MVLTFLFLLAFSVALILLSVNIWLVLKHEIEQLKAKVFQAESNIDKCEITINHIAKSQELTKEKFHTDNYCLGKCRHNYVRIIDSTFKCTDCGHILNPKQYQAYLSIDHF
jgi:hypothetical protein